MAVVSMMKMSGDADELAAKLRDGVEPVARRLAPGHGGLGSVVCKTDDGILVINLWENEEGRHAMAEEPEVLQALQSAGLPQPNFHAHEILTMTILPEAVREAG